MIKVITSILIAVFLFSFGYDNNKAESYKNNSAYSQVQKNSVVHGNVVHVADGDTVTVLLNNNVKIKVRLYGIDAPEKAQAYGPQSTGILKHFVANKNVSVAILGTDKYGRKLGRIYLGNTDINAEMVRLGAAWHYKQYDKSSKYNQYAMLEQEAKANRKGLWNKPNPLAPWDFRKMQRENRKK